MPSDETHAPTDTTTDAPANEPASTPSNPPTAVSAPGTGTAPAPAPGAGPVMNDVVRGLLDARHMAVLVTLNPDGGPQSSVVWVSRDGDELLISTTRARRKARNVLRDPRVGLTVFDPADPDLYVEIRGTAAVTEDTGRAVAVRIAEEYLGPGGGKEYAEAPADHVRVVVRVTPTRILGSATRAVR
ncbi:PPOX class F420-dependent oxidoreductase [Streptomyces sp. NPDC047972]|uniref:PPOX class F420-dependent oxidoreductase n=1 Tax=Streptomyces sp. NPDC047972 TaxID=3365493 RepID=UPI00371057A2